LVFDFDVEQTFPSVFIDGDGEFDELGFDRSRRKEFFFLQDYFEDLHTSNR